MNKNIPVSNPGCDEHDPGLMRVEQVHEKLAQLVSPVKGTERVAIRTSLGRVLAEPVISNMNVPPYANSAMDGYAVLASDIPVLVILGRQDNYIPFNEVKDKIKLNANGEIHALDGSGHMGFIEEPLKSIELITSFIEKSAG